jgi:hypothetical protein
MFIYRVQHREKERDSGFHLPNEMEASETAFFSLLLYQIQ